MTKPLNLVWLRRDLRLRDQTALSHALQDGAQVQPIFIFDSVILKRFSRKDDRRLSFIAQALCDIDAKLHEHGGQLLVFHGNPVEIIPKLVAALQPQEVVVAEDYEPACIARDEQVAHKLKGHTQFTLVKDHVIFSPLEILKSDGTPFKVYTPYSRAWKERLHGAHYATANIAMNGRLADAQQLLHTLTSAGLNPLQCTHGAKALLAHTGYKHTPDSMWDVTSAHTRLQAFIRHHATNYANQRNFLAEAGTSRLSPYIRFGLISIRECVKAAVKVDAAVWLNELIWREFYIMTLYHTPESAHTEWNPRYRNRIAWRNSQTDFAAFCEGKTGYPVVDAAMLQLLAEGWMHNRARMIVASFLTKHLLIDWRWGEEHFAQYLMDYEQASNVGGWQWAASTGTDAQPYFRVFNPLLQAQKFDPDGVYVKRYVAELREVDKSFIHRPHEQGLFANPHYPPPMVEHSFARKRAIEVFKLAGG